MPRPKLDMSPDVWAAACRWVRHFVALGTQGEINLSGTGEPTLHPRLVEMVAEMRDILGPTGDIQFTTNGKGITRKLVAALAPYKPKVCVTNHHAHLAGPASRLFYEFGMLRHVSSDPVVNPQNWAGQVIWPQTLRGAYRPICAMLADGLATINADGTMVICCMDMTNETAYGTVFDDPATAGFTLHAWDKCFACWQQPPHE